MKRLLLPLLLLTALASAGLKSRGLVGYWPLENTALDASGSGNNGTGTNTSYVNGKLGVCDTFTGAAFVNFGTSLSSLTTITVCAWVKLTALGKSQVVVTAGYSYDQHVPWAMKTPDDDASGIVQFGCYKSGECRVVSVSKLTAGVWTHLAGTYDGTTWKIYFNGRLDNSAVNTGPVANAERCGIGALSVNGSYWTQFWNGCIDEVHIWNRALSAADILRLYNTGQHPVN